MATSEGHEQSRKQWTRAKAPRVRTGCITCKIRHLKCDENKPECKRCLKDKHRCDGYQQAQVPRPKSRAKAKLDDPLELLHYRSKLGIAAYRACGVLRPAPSLINNACLVDAALFHHAREYTIKDFDVDSCSSFWNIFVLPLSQTVEPVKYALCALGAAHRRFITGYHKGDSTCVPATAAFEVASIQKYNQAIMSMKPLMAEDTEVSLQTILICCVIFICIENLHGRYTDSIRHLHAGRQLLNSFRGKSRQERGSFAQSYFAQIYYKEEPGTKHNSFDMILEMLHRLEQNVAIYHGSNTIVDLKLPSQNIDMGDPRLPFVNLVEAGTLLDQVEELYEIFFLSAESRSRTVDAANNNNSPCSNLAPGHLALAASRSAFAIWSSRYEITKHEKRYETPSPTQHYGLASLDLHQAIWSAIIKLDTVYEEFSKEDSEVVLQRAFALSEISAGKRAPVFAFNGHIIPALSIVCSSCKDLDIQRKSIALLRKLHRREGIWDSQEVADIHESTMKAGLQSKVHWADLPWGIPQLAAMLSSLSLAESNNYSTQSS